MNNLTNYPLLIELKPKLFFNEIDNIDESSDLRVLVQLKDSSDHVIATFPQSKIMNVTKTKSSLNVALNHICFENTNAEQDNLVFYRIDREDLNSIDPIHVPSRLVNKVLVDGVCVWPQNQ